ncbi:hypothetical protein BJX68DRAFT_223352 [Aspergillus pseudodeflectus]|uniref:Uncharacterized protein n=1 Tax=Aspergillus pseudodeflectus TaxID=176178 RepID=A0ABR4LBD6_9EURO
MATDILLRNSNINDAFLVLVTLPKQHGNHCLYIFIDVLDEYKENRQVRHKDFVKLLTDWVGIGHQELKLCVSSQEYSLFSSIAPDNQRLWLTGPY